MSTYELFAAHRPTTAWFRPGLWLSVARHRAALAKLDAARLADIGLTPTVARAEAARPFWDVPAHWRR